MIPVAPLLIAPAVMVVTAVVERQFGVAAGGWVSAAPMTVVASGLGVSASLGPDAAASFFLSAAAHVVAQVTFAVLCAFVSRRRGVLLGLLSGISGYAVLSMSIVSSPALPPILAGVIALTVGRHLLVADGAQRPDDLGSPRRELWLTLARAGSALLAVLSVLVTAQLVSPRVAGAVGAYPAVTTALVLLVGLKHGRQGVWDSLGGLVRGLPAYLAFCLTAWTLSPSTGTGIATILGLCACLAVFRLVLPVRKPR